MFDFTRLGKVECLNSSFDLYEILTQTHRILENTQETSGNIRRQQLSHSLHRK